MFTHEKLPKLFTDLDGREAYLASLDAGGEVPSGTAMTHVLASKIAPFGDLDLMRRDAARILLAEIDTQRRQDGMKPLGIPVEGVINDPLFRRAFSACSYVNGHEVDAWVTAGFPATFEFPPLPPKVAKDVAWAQSAAFAVEVRDSLEQRTQRYHEIKGYCDNQAAELGFL